MNLVAMPWQSFDLPSLPLALLRARLAEARPQDTVHEYYGYLRWAEFLLERTDGEITPAVCEWASVTDVFHGLGDWVFAGVLHGDPQWRVDRIRDYPSIDPRAGDVGPAMAMRPHAAGFIDLAAAEILACEPQVVGLTTTFMQNVAVLSVARRLKELAPDVVIVLGGGNCDGPMGHALHRNHPFVDYVVRGEGEIVFPRLLERIERGLPPDDLPGVCWWKGEDSVANAMADRAVPPAVIPRPNFDEWQRVLHASPVSRFVEPKLLLEGARGCWWGEKHQCTFCGLNGTAIGFRSQPAERFWKDLEYLVTRHRILDIVTVDNIMDMAYFQDLLPRIAQAGWDLRLHYEVKANLRPEQIRMLAEAGVHCQPGIESLSTRVLDLMDKGATGAINVRMLRDCETQGISASWNYLCGFPGETADDYLPIIDQIPALSHLQAPQVVGRIYVERFSPYFEDSSLGFAERRPHPIYDHVYDLPEEELLDLVYLLDSPPAGISAELERRLQDACETWRDGYVESSLLIREDVPERLLIEDRRTAFPAADYELTGWAAAAYRLLEQGRTAEALARELAGPGLAQVRDWLAEQAGRGLLFTDDDTHLALATRALPTRKMVKPLEEIRRWRIHI